ncbi:telomere binding protein [Linderina pennispora]|nr:telomere binding protein [Linderina pennispora]
MTWKEDLRAHFRLLEKRIEELALEFAPPKAHDLAVAKTSASSERIGGIIIPGIGPQHHRPLITPLDDDHHVTVKRPAANTDELLACIEAPSALLRLSEPKYLSEKYAWAQWWTADIGGAQKSDVVRLLGPWISRCVLSKASNLLVALPSSDRQLLLFPYVSKGNPEASWQVLQSLVGMLSNRATRSGLSQPALTLIVALLDHAVSAGVVSPDSVLQSITAANAPLPLHRSLWSEYLQTMAALPDRLAGVVDPQSIPICLTPRVYYAAIARSTAAVIECDHSVPSRMLLEELCSKLCRVGQADCLGVEITASLLAAAKERIALASVPENDRLRKSCCVLSRVQPPFGPRLVSAVMQQLDTVVGRVIAEDDSCARQIGEQAAVIIASILFEYVDRECTQLVIDHAILSLVKSPVGTYWSATTYQAIALALQMLSGKSSDEELSSLLPSRVFPDLLEKAVTGSLLPMWSLPELVTYGQVEHVKALTSLVLALVGLLDKKERTRLSTSAAFMRAIPRFLDAPIAQIKLSGIIVADAVANCGDGESLDFGLDDIIRDSLRTDIPPGTRALATASADYIAEMRKYLLPVKSQWAKSVKSNDTVTAKAVDFIREYVSTRPEDSDLVLAPRQSSLVDSQQLTSGFVKPRTPVFLHDCLAYLKDANDMEKTKIGLFALAGCVGKANAKTVEELWLPAANKLLFLYNRGPDDLDWAWDLERRRALAALAVRLPEQIGPFLADKSCDRNLTIKDREIVFSAISNACLQLSGISEDEIPKERILEDPVQSDQPSAAIGAGTVVRRSRKLDLAKQRVSGAATSELDKKRRLYSSIVGPAFFFPLISQYGKSDMSTGTSDIRGDASVFEKYLNTLAVILYTAGSATHLLRMNREFWDLAKLVRRMKARNVSESPPVLDALLFGLDVALSPDRALSAPTLANEFRGDIADTLVWISSLMEQNRLGDSTMAHASRIVMRLHEIQGDVRRRVTSSDIHQFTSII